ncbi:MAG: biotin carboxylase N-terminal domain-containing protein [Cumulibacter sp.]
MFSKVLIANRGEIASRIIRTVRDMGIGSVAVYSDADADAKHVSDADEAVHLGPTNARESYLAIDKVLKAAKDTGADAVHPGYGFLAENAAFAQACIDAGITFIGPSPAAIETMGDKISAKKTVAAAGVPVVPGRSEPDMSDDDLYAAALEVGFPVLIKPSAGGGGKGMYLVEAESDLRSSIESARREAENSFGNDTLFLERYVKNPRHLEVQVLADSHGATIHLGERECSLQRRHQKIIEEAPSALLDEQTRARIGKSAVDTAASVGYSGAGTVEFIVSGDRPDEYFFMEMNTRLQVEHPVTEMVTGIDLVEQQILVAAGDTLHLTQDDIELTGHAIEARVYAENPDRDFLPTGGTVLELNECDWFEDPDAETTSSVRIDSALIDGLQVATTYDPMIAKVIAHGADRAEALERLDDALTDYQLFGVVSNVQFLRALITHPRVLSGDLDTGLVGEQIESLVRRQPPIEVYAALAADFITRNLPSDTSDPFCDIRGWRAGRDPVPMRFAIRGSTGEPVTIEALVTQDWPLRAQVTVEHDSAEVDIDLGGAGEFLIRLDDGIESRARVLQTDSETWVWIEDHGTYVATRLAPENELGIHGAAADGEVRSPMPGTVLAIHTSEGAEVAEGEPLAVVEAMKMEHVLTAPIAGTVTELGVVEGGSVLVDELILHVVPTT